MSRPAEGSDGRAVDDGSEWTSGIEGFGEGEAFRVSGGMGDVERHEKRQGLYG